MRGLEFFFFFREGCLRLTAYSWASVASADPYLEPIRRVGPPNTPPPTPPPTHRPPEPSGTWACRARAGGVRHRPQGEPPALIS